MHCANHEMAIALPLSSQHQIKKSLTFNSSTREKNYLMSSEEPNNGYGYDYGKDRAIRNLSLKINLASARVSGVTFKLVTPAKRLSPQMLTYE